MSAASSDSRARGARGPKWSKLRAGKVLGAMKAGAGLSRAAEIAGVSRQTVWYWRKRGKEEGRGPLFDFDLEVAKIEAGDIASAERTIKEAVRQRVDLKSAINAATWYLERKLPDEYGKHDTLTIDNRNLAVQLLEFLREKLDAATYNRVLVALSPAGSVGADPQVLELS